jgi:proteasome lid subunit RPN8/RPN11
MNAIRAVDIDFIDGFNAAAKSAYPEEFLCMTREIDGVVSEMIMLPGTVFGDSHSFLNQWMAPIDYSIAGTAHSHPGFSNCPSDADKEFFANMGGVHFITCQPYDRTSWRAYDSRGDPMDIEVIYRPFVQSIRRSVATSIMETR